MLENLNIQNYRGFKSYSIKNLSKINLFTGANNVGKSSLLEIFEIFTYTNSGMDFIRIINSILDRRQKEFKECDLIYANDESFTLYNDKKKLKCSVLSLDDVYKENINLKLPENLSSESRFIKVNLNGKEEIFPFKLIDTTRIGVLDNRYINSCFMEENLIFRAFEKIKEDRSKFKDLNQYLSKFDSNIEMIDFFPGNKFKVFLKNIENPILLSSLGEGINRYFSILINLISNSKYLFIDEIENGIFYKHLPLVWDLIFTYVKNFNMQIFITTHSKEVIDSFYFIAKKHKFFDIRLIEMRQNDNIVLDFEMLKSEILNENELRRW